MSQCKLKIAFLHRANDPYTMERIKYFKENHHDIYSISFSSNYSKPKHQIEINGVNVIRLKELFIDKLPFIKRISHFFELKKILKVIRPDVLHIVNALNLFYIDLNSSKVKIIENQGSDVIISPLRFRLLKLYYKHYYKKVNGVIQDSQVAYENGIKYGASEDPGLNKIIEIGVDFNIFNKNVPKGIIKERYNLENRQIIFHSRALDENYNIDIILKSILLVRKEFPNCVYIITATIDELNKELSSFIIENQLRENLLFVGYQDRIKELKYFYRDADINLSIPSSDSSPFSVYESMACMTPNIVTDLPWLYSKFTPNKHLITCPVHNYRKLAELTIRLLKEDIKLDLQSAYNVVLESINYEIENQKLEELYRYLLKIN